MANMRVNECDCVILCGGLGKRLRSVVDDVPKVMAQVEGRPFLDFIIEYLKGQGIQRIVLCTGYKADVIENYYRDHDFGIVIDFSREEESLGTGGAVKNARAIVLSDPFFVCNGDSFLSADFQAFLDFHKEKESDVSMVVVQAGERKDFGSVEVDTNTGQITSFTEKREHHSGALVNAGIYCFNQAMFSRLPQDAKFSLENDFFPSLAGNKFYGHYVDEFFFDIGTPERYKLAQQKLTKENTRGNENT